MTEARAIWTDKDRFLGEANSGHALVMDAGDPKTASTPMEMVLIALCGCTASDVVGILRKKREPFTSLEVRAEAERAEDFPKVYTSIKLIYRVGGNVSRGAMERAVQLSKEKYCSVSTMLEKTAKIEFVIEYGETMRGIVSHPG
jgi:putative redox protein